jgi:hypothetical protein
MLFVCALITSISINVYTTISSRYQVKKQDSVVVEVPITPEKEIVHDTVFIEKVIVKPIDSSKPKKEIDTSKYNDSVVK